MTYKRKGPHLHKNPMTIQDLYPDLTPEQQAEAERCLTEFIGVIKRIHERTHGRSSRSKGRM